jgi:hypothetical protein
LIFILEIIQRFFSTSRWQGCLDGYYAGMNFGENGTISFSVLPNTPLPTTGFSFKKFTEASHHVPKSDPHMIFLGISELAELTGLCTRTIRGHMAQEKFRWHGVGKRKFINLAEFLEDTEFC